MTDQAISLAAGWKHFSRTTSFFVRSEVGARAIGSLVALMLLLLAVNGMNVVNSYVGRDFMTAIADRDMPQFMLRAAYYVGVFAISTLLSVTSRFIEERLALLWREFLTRRSIGRYLAHGNYYRLDAYHLLANPDQRIAEDIRSFTTTTLSFMLMMLNSGFTFFAFAGVLWTISPLLFGVAIAYAALGSLFTVLLGRPLIGLNSAQLDREADFRSELIHVRENAEGILLSGSEERLSHRLHIRISALVENFRRIIGINRNLGLFSTWYNWLIQIIPALIVAPSFMAGRVEFGVVTQSAMAFSTLVAAFSLVITQFQSISSFAAVLARLSSLVEAIDKTEMPDPSNIEIREDDTRFAYEGLTLRTAEKGQILVDNLSLVIPPKGRVLISASSVGATLALFQVTAGLDAHGEGRVVRPDPHIIKFLAERPYLAHGTLRDALVPPGMEAAISDWQLLERLIDWRLDRIPARTQGLHTDQDWENQLSLGEQQLLAAIRIELAAPQFVILDRPGTSLGTERVREILTRFSAAGIGYLQLGRGEVPDELYDKIVEISADGVCVEKSENAAHAISPLGQFDE
jgi:putative ATP-binding cassette transporter